MNNYYTIGQLAKLAGISTKTLRVYERKNLLLPERNGENDYRIYGEEAVKTLGKIQLMKYLDFSLDQIADFLQLYENASRENVLLEQKRLLEKKREQVLAVMPSPERVVLKPGFFPESLDGLEETFCFVSLDVDFEPATLAGLRYF